jgi:hypothetical protein
MMVSWVPDVQGSHNLNMQGQERWAKGYGDQVQPHGRSQVGKIMMGRGS